MTNVKIIQINEAARKDINQQSNLPQHVHLCAAHSVSDTQIGNGSEIRLQFVSRIHDVNLFITHCR